MHIPRLALPFPTRHPCARELKLSKLSWRQGFRRDSSPELARAEGRDDKSNASSRRRWVWMDKVVLDMLFGVDHVD